MALYRESLLNKIEDDLAGRNQNWATLEAHLETSNKHIAESGSNYIKFDDGTAICWGEKSITGRIADVWGSLYYLLVGTITFPTGVGFIARPYVSLVNRTQGKVIIPAFVGVTPVGIADVEIYRPVPDTADTTYTIGYIAIGRWK